MPEWHFGPPIKPKPPNADCAPAPPARRLLTGREVASLFSVTVQQVHNQLHRADLPHYRLSTAVRFDLVELKAATARRGRP